MQSIMLKESGELGNPRLDTPVAAAFIVLLYTFKCAIFHINLGLQELYSSDHYIVSNFYNKLEGTVVQLVILVILIIFDNHLDKTVMQPGRGIYVKGRDKTLPG